MSEEKFDRKRKYRETMMRNVSEKKRKLLLLGITGALCGAIMLGGTFAWSAISQTALNEITGVMNSGGRLHDDFDGTGNKDIYVENYTTAPGNDLIVRVRLREYIELTKDGTVRWKTDGAEKEKKSSWSVYELPELSELTQDGNEMTDSYAAHEGCSSWTFGGKTVYMPTFLKDNESLTADFNGTSAKKYTDYQTYQKGAEKSGSADYGKDGTQTETHYADETQEGIVLSMAQWIAQKDARLGAYWVYDTDGWAYWAQPLKPGEATGLLLSGIDVKIPEDYAIYYGIYVESQMVTAGEAEKLSTPEAEGGGGSTTASAKQLIEKLKDAIAAPTAENRNQSEEAPISIGVGEVLPKTEVNTEETEKAEEAEETEDGEEVREDEETDEAEDEVQPPENNTNSEETEEEEKEPENTVNGTEQDEAESNAEGNTGQMEK